MEEVVITESHEQPARNFPARTDTHPGTISDPNEIFSLPCKLVWESLTKRIRHTSFESA